MKHFLLSLLVVCVILGMVHTVSAEFVFEENLSIGDSSFDVYELQKFLNTNIQTQITQSGTGSAGNETYYFGNLTKNAVTRFQNMYKKEILEPVGLEYGTGYVGASTRAKLNTFSQSTRKNSIESSSDILDEIVVPHVLHEYKDLILANPSLYTGTVGTKITLHGLGFESINTVYFGETKIENVESIDGETMSFLVPDISYGKYALEVKNSKGKTDTDTFFVIKDASIISPVVESVSPSEILYGQKVTLTGSGFTLKNNEIRTSYGVIEGVASRDEKTLVFEVRPFPDTPGIEDGVDMGQNVTWPITIRVINDNGVSNTETVVLTY